MTRTALFLSTAIFLIASCTYTKSGPYKGYSICNDEAIPASSVGGAPYKTKL